jgi:hypothetical protein
MGALTQSLRYALRMLGRNPGFTAASVLCLALGIGATTANFSVVNAVLLRQLPHARADRLVRVFTANSCGCIRLRLVHPPRAREDPGLVT